MVHSSAQIANDIGRIKRVSQLFCTMHAALRDRYRIISKTFDLITLLFAGWLSLLSFAQSEVMNFLSPYDIPANLWVGVMGVIIFSLGLLQISMGWSGKASAHSKSLELFSAVTKQARSIDLDDPKSLIALYPIFLAQYELANSGATDIPEHEFLRLKQRHLLKKKISRLLDERPGASILLTRLGILWRDNRPKP